MATVLGLGTIGFVGCGGGSSTPAEPVVEYNSTVPRTGQTISYAQYDDGWYVTNQGLGVERSFIRDATTQVVTDNVTGLEWEDMLTVERPAGLFGIDAFSTTRDNAQNLHCAPLGAGWRLPTILELISITDKGKSGGSIFDTFEKIGGTLTTPYWSDTLLASDITQTWVVKFEARSDTTRSTDGTDGNAYSRCVKGTEYVPPAGRFDTSTGNVVIDTWTNLMWQDNEISTATNWQDAIDQCEALELVGKTDWRLPNFNELYSMADRLSGVNPAIDTAFNFTEEGKYWTSTTYDANVSVAWGVDFTDGRDFRSAKSTVNRPFRCVRTR